MDLLGLLRLVEMAALYVIWTGPVTFYKWLMYTARDSAFEVHAGHHSLGVRLKESQFCTDKFTSRTLNEMH